MARHLAIFKGQGAEKILSGEKTVESRFSKRKNPPFGVVATGDLVYIKPSGKDIIGQFKVKKVIFYDGVDASEIREKYGSKLAVDESYWSYLSNKSYATLMFIGTCSRFITSPVKLKKKDLRGWVVLS